MLWWRIFLNAFYFVYATILMGVPLLIYYLAVIKKDSAFVIQQTVALVFCCLTVPVSIFGVGQHLLYYHQPKLQRYVVRILWMVPLYSVESYLSLIANDYSLYIRAVRELYEAYVIYSFLYFLIYYLGEEEELARKLARKDAHYGNGPFLRWIGPWKMGSHFLWNCKFGVLQYVVLKVLTTIATMILQAFNVYQEDLGYKWEYGSMYIAAINNCTQTYALYVLVIFYNAAKEDLAPIHPIFKFICVKMVVFFSFWQGLAISIAVSWGFITSPDPEFSDVIYSMLLQDFLIVIEMFLGAASHQYAFDYHEFYLDKESTPIIKAFLDSANPQDTLREVQKNMHLTGGHSRSDSSHVKNEEEQKAFDRSKLFAKFTESDFFERGSVRLNSNEVKNLQFNSPEIESTKV